MVSAAGRRRLPSLLTVHLSLVVAAVVEDDSESVPETPTTSAWSPAAAGARDVAGRTASGRRRGTRAATAAPACRPVCARVGWDTQRRQRGQRQSLID